MRKFPHQKSVLWAGMLALLIGTSAPLAFSAGAQDAVVSPASPIPLKPMHLPAHSPAPYGATPSPAQVQWQEMETYAFLHFGLNTYTGKEWGYGDESENLFN
nr:hypothetical protein [Armatimonadota bacterium]